jgi:hypothetical protein
MSVQDDKVADDGKEQQSRDDRGLTEKPEPDEDAKEKAAEMMKSYEDRPTLVLPGSGGSVSGTAVGDWLDEDGNPKYHDESSDNKGSDDDQVEKDKALNEQLKEAAAEENKGEKR